MLDDLSGVENHCQALAAALRVPHDAHAPIAFGRYRVERIERFAGVILREHASQRRVLLLDGEHRFINQLADGWLLGFRFEVRPACGLWNPEDVFAGVLVAIFGIGVRLVRQLRVLLLERV